MKYRTPTKAIVTDAGCASRYLPLTKTVPKGMLPIGAKPIMQLVIEECAAAGIKEIILVATHEGKATYEDYFENAAVKIKKQLHSQGKDDRYAPVRQVLDLPKITIIEQDPALPYGNGSPIASARKFIQDDEAFVVLYSDDIVFGSSDVRTLIDAYAEHPEAKAIIIAQEMPREVLHKYGIIKLADPERMTLDNIVEKPKPEEAPSNLINVSKYIMSPKLLDEVVKYVRENDFGPKEQEYVVTDPIQKYIDEGGIMHVATTDGEYLDGGTLEGWVHANNVVCK